MSDTPLEGLNLAHECCRALHNKKGLNLMVLDLKGTSSFTDYFVICNGSSDRHVKALYQEVNTFLKKEFGTLPHHIEGQQSGQWILMDYHDVIVHIFFDYLRDYYALENFWKDAEILPLPDFVKNTSEA